MSRESVAREIAASEKHRRNSCLGKKQHQNRKSAREHAERLSKRGIIYDVYKCGFCGWFHVGHQR